MRRIQRWHPRASATTRDVPRSDRSGDRRSVEQVEQRDQQLLNELQETFADAVDKAGPWLACRPGCADCCYGPFPITALDTRRLRRGLARLREADPSRVRRILVRAGEARHRMADGYPGDVRGGKLEATEQALDRFFAGHADLACPCLDPRNGHCDLYEWRPIACRSYGPPLRFGERDAPACKLCYRGAPPSAVERGRVQPDPHGLEQQLLERLGVEPGEEWETLIAFAME